MHPGLGRETVRPAGERGGAPPPVSPRWRKARRCFPVFYTISIFTRFPLSVKWCSRASRPRLCCGGASLLCRRAPIRGPHQKDQSSWNGSAAAAAETAEPALAIAGDRSGWSGAKGAVPAQAAVAAAKTAAKLAGRAAGGGGGRGIAGIAVDDAALAGMGAGNELDLVQSCPAQLTNGDMPVAAASGMASSA
jgi:hypothetical protein